MRDKGTLGHLIAHHSPISQSAFGVLFYKMAFRFLKNISQALRGDESPTEEGIGDKRVLLKLSMKDDDLIREIDKDILTARPIYDEMKQVQDENEQYWLGTQLNRKYFSYELPTDQNILYRNLETLISIITAKRREPIVLPAQGNDESRELAEHNQNFLSWKWSEQDMSVKFEDWVRHSMIYRIGVLKVRWNLETDDFEVENIRPQKVMIDKDARNELEAKFIVEFREDIMADLIRMYPDSKDKLTKAFGKQKGTKVKYIEYWTNEFTVMKVNKIVLDKKKNPNWNWDETPKQREKNLKKLKERWIEKTKDEKLTNLLLNYFNEPRKPYIILSLKSLNKSIYADSVTPDTPILVRRYGKFLDIIPIEELAPNFRKDYQCYWEKCRHIDQNIEVLTKEGKWSKISYVYRHKVNKPIYTIVTGEGVTKVTGDHSLFQDGKEVKVKELKAKDKIDVIDFNFQNDFSEITKDYAYAIGFFVAEGWTNGVKFGFRNNDWSISQKEPEKLEKVKSILEQVWHQTFVVKQSSNGMYVLTSIGKKEELVNWFRKHCYTRSAEKRIPVSILNSDKTIKRAFLEGYWDGDGYGKISEGIASCSTKSFVLASGVSYLLKCLGYHSGMGCRKDKKSDFAIEIIRSTRRKQHNEIKDIYCRENDDFVYDIETVDENHSFIAGVGNIVHHNTSDFDQGKRGQDIVNKRKRHIDRAAVHSLGRTVVSGDVIDKKEAKKIIANPNAPLWLKRGRPQDAIQHIAPLPVSPVLLEDLRDTKAELDNTMGVHGTSRGERGPQETATGRTILREGDMGRADLAVRRIDKKLELLYAWMCQMAKVYYTDDHWIKWLGGEGAASYLKFSRDDIEDGQEIVVKSEMTADKATQRQMADQRMQMGIIDPLTYLEKLDESNPKEKARRLVFYLTDPKLYLQQFLIDENTEGAENDPLGKAKQEQSQLLEGEEVPPFTGVTQDHLQEHIKFGKSSELKGADVTVEDNFMRHLQQESELLKGQTQV